MSFVPGESNATAASAVWCKHISTATVWCAVRSVADGSAATYCDGRWAVYDASQFAIHDEPPVAERCAACVRVMTTLFDAVMPDEGGDS